MILDMFGNETRIAHDGAEALDVAADFHPDVVLLDIGMPKLDGYEVARQIRQQPWGKEVVLVAVTGWSQDEIRERSQQAGFDAHLVKPVERVALEHVLAGLDRRRAPSAG
jgi:CheY-like chemotaxis protein